MKVLTMYGAHDMRLEERPIPHADENQLVVKIDYVGVCGSDVEFYVGHIPPFLRLPMIPGHENVGTVVEVGEGITDFKAGDRIICGPPGYCKELCPSCREGKNNICLTAFPERTAGFGYVDGGYAEYLLIRDVAHTSLIKVPDAVDLKDAVLFDIICVGIHGVRISRFKVGDSVVVSGAGAIGLPVIQFLKAGGASKIIVLDVNEEKEQIVKQFGGDYFINTSACKDVSGAIKEILGSEIGVDVAFECSGVPASHQTCITCIKPGGQIVCVGSITQPLTVIPGVFQPFEPDFQYSFVYTEADIKIYMDMLAAGKVDFNGMVTGVFSLGDVVEKYLESPRKDHIKVLIDPSR